LDFQVPFSINQTAILWSCELHFSLPEPSSPQQGAVVALTEKSRTGKPCFSAHSTDTSRTLTSSQPDFAAPIAYIYPVATGKAALSRRRPITLASSTSAVALPPANRATTPGGARRNRPPRRRRRREPRLAVPVSVRRGPAAGGSVPRARLTSARRGGRIAPSRGRRRRRRDSALGDLNAKPGGVARSRPWAQRDRAADSAGG